MDLPILTPIAAISSQSDSQEFATTAMCEDCHKSVTTSTDQDESTLSLQVYRSQEVDQCQHTKDQKLQQTTGGFISKDSVAHKLQRFFGVTRQSVWDVLRNHGYDLRRKKQLPFVEFEGKRYTPDDDGYYRCTERDHNQFLHRVFWKRHNGAIPDGYHIHHINGDKSYQVR